jgi:hypothetical protein
LGPELARTKEFPGRLIYDTDDACFAQVNALLSYGIRMVVSKRFSMLLKLGRLASSSGKYDTDILSAGFACRFGSLSHPGAP